MKVLTLLLTLLIALAFIGNALAVGPGKTVEFAGGAAGKVVFDGKTHAEKGLKCGDCHPKTFQMKKGGDKITMADINAGKFCGTCHNGEKAFKASECAKCHKK